MKKIKVSEIHFHSRVHIEGGPVQTIFATKDISIFEVGNIIIVKKENKEFRFPLTSILYYRYV